jgi:nitrogen fixation protein NifU and related proteins
MGRFSRTLMEHALEPRNEGQLAAPSAVGVAGVPGQGRYACIALLIEAGRVREARFQCQGCGVTIACCSVITELVIERSVEECRGLTIDELVQALDGLPRDKLERAAFVLSALHNAVAEG